MRPADRERRFDRDRDRDARVLMVGRDRRFLMAATARLARLGYYTVATDRPSQIGELVERRKLTVVVVDGSDYLTATCRHMATIEALAEPVGVVMVAEDAMISPLTSGRVRPKWGSLDTLHEEVERAYARRFDHEAGLATA
jgi:hypothetical protein